MTYIDTLSEEKRTKLYNKLPDSTDFEIYLKIVDHMLGGFTHGV